MESNLPEMDLKSLEATSASQIDSPWLHNLIMKQDTLPKKSSIKSLICRNRLKMRPVKLTHTAPLDVHGSTFPWPSSLY